MMDEPEIRIWPGAIPIAWRCPLRNRWHFRIPLLIGQVNIHPTEDELFSERYGHTPTWRVRGWSFCWRRYR